MRTLLSLLVGLMLCGCNHLLRTQSGDFPAFLTKEVARLGGHRRGTNELPMLTAHWSVQSDVNGFEVHLLGTRFIDVESLLHQAYGEPSLLKTNEVGRPVGHYQATDIGVGIIFYGEKDGVGINCIRGFKDIGEMYQRSSGK